MRFEARELKPYAEPVEVQKLIVGQIYFSLNFLDDEMLLPALEPVVFIGRDLESGDRDQVYFQDANSYLLGARYDTATPDVHADVYVGHADDVNHIFVYEKALETLMGCSLRRSKTESKEAV